MWKIKLYSSLLLLFICRMSHSVVIDDAMVLKIQACLKVERVCEFPERVPNGSPVDENIYIQSDISWDTDAMLTLVTKKSIFVEKDVYVKNSAGGVLNLRPGMEPGDLDFYKETVVFYGKEPFQLTKNGRVNIFYNPHKAGKRHKYHNPQRYRESNPSDNVESYMLVNDVYDLQGISAFPSGNFALSQDIDGSVTKQWNKGQGFTPVGRSNYPFSGSLEGNGYTISNVHILRRNNDNVGLFGYSSGIFLSKNRIADLVLKRFHVEGHNNVGSLVGLSTYTNMENVRTEESYVSGKLFIGGLVGSIWGHNDNFLSKTESIGGSVHGEEAGLSNGLILKKGSLVGLYTGNSCLSDSFENLLKVGTCYSGKEISSVQQFLEKINEDNLTKNTELWKNYNVCKLGESLVLSQDNTIHCTDMNKQPR